MDAGRPWGNLNDAETQFARRNNNAIHRGLTARPANPSAPKIRCLGWILLGLLRKFFAIDQRIERAGASAGAGAAEPAGPPKSDVVMDQVEN